MTYPNRQVDFWKQFIISNLQYNLDYLVANSIKDFHVKGFNYVCFQFLPHLTIRLYIIEPSEPFDTSKINIHNHLYDSQILVLKGSITNNVYKTYKTGKVNDGEYNHYYLTSALHPDNKEKKIKLDYLGKIDLVRINEIELKQGDTHFQNAAEIHNVFNDPTQLTAFMIWEYPTVKHNSILYSKKDHGTTINTEGSYNRYTKEELTNLLTDLIKRL